jgi:hypothetical protein
MYFIMLETVPVGHEPMRLERLDKSYTKPWMSGARFSDADSPPNPYALRINPELGGSMLMELYQNAGVVMSKRLISALQAAGVDNLDLYPATILNEETGEIDLSYAAVNIIGVVAAADLSRTVFDPGVTDRLIAASIDSLAIDEGAARGHRLFRLAESVETIVVHESVKRCVEAEGFDTVVFTQPKDLFTL